MKSFEYFCPKSISELVKLLSKYDGKASILAGGTDLLVMMKQERVQPDYIISLKGIPNLSYINEQRNHEVKIGAMTLIREIECSNLLQAKYPLLSKAAGWIGSPQVRWRATCGGNLCNGAPSADLAPPLICLGAKAVVQGKGKRIIPLQQFFLGPGKVDLKKGEFLNELVIPSLPPNTFGTYLKFTRSAMDIAVVGVAAIASFRTGGECTNLRICLGAVAPTPMRAIQAERIGMNNTWNDEVISAMASMASSESKPIDDVRGTIFLRKNLVEVLTRRALMECLEQAREGKF
jgi:CO/xanthine dehydrogenase FAD-binding subunit